MKEDKLSLLELNLLVRELIETEMPNEYWVEAEIGDLHEVGGNCYMELIEKDERTNTPVAKASAKCWRSRWALVKAHFLRETGKNMARGMKVLLKVCAQFHENYGFSWIVNDVDPTFTMGDMALKRQRIISKLKEEGVFDANRELSMPLFTQRIAVISSAGAAGYGDFCNHLADNEFGYTFRTRLFPAIMQGEGVEQSVIGALNKVFEQLDDFDCVVIARGGGATSDLSGFDALDLARNVANFPLPVITAIGHDRDESVLDMVANVRVKTPTAAAAFLIDRLHQLDETINNFKERLTRVAVAVMQQEQLRVNHLSIRIPALFAVVKTRQGAKLDALASRARVAALSRTERAGVVLERIALRIPAAVRQKISNERHRLDIISHRMAAVDPQRILDMGFSITMHEGKVVRSTDQLASGDTIETRLKNGKVESVVK